MSDIDPYKEPTSDLDQKNEQVLQDHINAVNSVQWAIQQAYPIAVHLRGITDWTNDFKTQGEQEHAQRTVEDYQLRIAELILWSLRFR